ncbi:hypothetical protein GXM_03865 [Nostoc sphaeroides CCNUC1]|uniref:Uncharacterized protein n=1 Tax=Nostoc sphaeroides CCNUC1 TaxID=2653204 RepID=A0A5P8W1B3_9NOSO|nr:hypothetical protein GXM_03865 [Nostoc sphaeroides CCNUC1]
MNRQRSTVNNSNGIFFYLEVPNLSNLWKILSVKAKLA